MYKLAKCMICLVLSLTMGISIVYASASVTLSSSDAVRKDMDGTFPSAVLTEQDQLVCQSETLTLYANMETKIFKVEDHRNGYVFASGRNDEATSVLSRKWIAYAASPLVADFIIVNNMNITSRTPDMENVKITLMDDGLMYTVYYLDDEKTKTVNEECTIHMYVRLENDSLAVSIPDDEIVMSDKGVKLNKISVLPFIGAAFTGEGDGYLFIPDGAGALIRFDAPTANRAITLRSFAKDRSLLALGESKELLSPLATKEAETAMVPVMGIAHGGQQNAFIAWVEEGDLYTEILASPAGNNNLPCYYACIQGVYNEMYKQPSNGSDDFTVAQSKTNQVNLKLRYTFLAEEDATYIGMADAYRSYLEKTGLLFCAEKDDQNNIPMLLDCLMEESTKSLLGTSKQVMTRYEDVLEWAEYLLTEGIHSLYLSLEGTASGGVSRSRYDDMSSDSALGSIEMLAGLKEQGVTVLMNRRFLQFYGDQLPNSCRAYASTRRFITSTEHAYLDDELYYLRLTKLGDLVAKALEHAQDGVASDDLGRYLFAGYQSPSDYTRLDAQTMLENAMSTLSNAGILALSQPSVYALPYTDLAYDMPLSHSAMPCETDAVPFMQILLSGYIPAFSRSYVAGGTSVETLLRMIDFNLYPHYTMTEESAALLNKSNSSNLFSTEADALLSGAVEEYNMLNDILGAVYGQKIVNRQIPEDGVSIVTYANGDQIAVNYSETAYCYNGIQIEAKSAKLLKGGMAK